MNLISLWPRRNTETFAARLRSLATSNLHRDVAGTIGTSIAVQASLLVSGVAVARVLGVTDRGHLALFILLSTVLPILLTMGLPLALTYWIAAAPELGRRLIRRVRMLIAWQLVALLIVHAAVLYVVFRHSPGYVQRAALLSLLSSPAVALWSLGMAVLQGNQEFRALNISRMVSPPINAAVMLTLLATGTRSLFLATVSWTVLIWLTALLTGVAALRGLRDDAADDTPAVPSIRALLGFSLRALLGSVTPLEGFQLDQAIVGIFISQAALGIYVVAVAFTNLPRFIAQSIGLVAYPHVAADQRPRSAAQATMRFAVMTLLLCGAAVLIIELALPLLVPLLFGSAFGPAVGVARILLVSALLFALRRVLSECARGAGRPGLGSIAEIISLVTLFPAVALTSGGGARGVAIALVIAAGAGLMGIVIGWVARSPRRQRTPLVSSAIQPATGSAARTQELPRSEVAEPLPQGAEP